MADMYTTTIPLLVSVALFSTGHWAGGVVCLLIALSEVRV